MLLHSDFEGAHQHIVLSPGSIHVQVGDALMLVVIVVEWSVGFVLLSCLDEDIEVILGEFRILSRFCDQIVEHFENGRIGSYSWGLNGA